MHCASVECRNQSRPITHRMMASTLMAAFSSLPSPSSLATSRCASLRVFHSLYGLVDWWTDTPCHDYHTALMRQSRPFPEHSQGL